jgi:PhzF family phenazine biosynthesis protein
LLSKYQDLDKVVLDTKSGKIPVVRDPSGVRLQVPIDFKIHAPYAHPKLKSAQKGLEDGDFVNGGGPEPIVSIVKGLSFFVVQISSEEALAKLHPYSERLTVPEDLLGAWSGWVSVCCFVEKEDGSVRTRMFFQNIEDPATGSASAALAGYLAEKKGSGTWRFEFIQGVEMGRKSEISVVVNVGTDGQVERIELAGSAVRVMEGSLTL